MYFQIALQDSNLSNKYFYILVHEMDWRLDYDEEEGQRSPIYHEHTNAPMFEYGQQMEENIPIVALYNIHGIEVANGIKQAVDLLDLEGYLLEGLALHPSEAAIS